ncbi:MAG: UDP-N-acetylmuramate--L-alanine ligase, partial [Chloroflexi bacterium]|nr:UDP-N-acetylmuramate--L-alanine ligase [Chloroflexota bacterium]
MSEPIRERFRHVHIVGIGGAAMSMIAQVLLDDGVQVSGSDLHLSELTERLAAQGATVYEGHREEQVDGADLVAVSSAIPRVNREIVEAEQRGIRVMKRDELLGLLMDERTGIAVAGAHGKTTTTAMTALILERAGLQPTFMVGGDVLDLGTNARRGAGPFLLAEADEYDRAFLTLHPTFAAVTNIEAEHLDIYGDFAGVVAAFGEFLAGVHRDGAVIINADDPVLGALAGRPNPGVPALDRSTIRAALVTTSIEGRAAWQADGLQRNERGGYDFRVLLHGNTVAEVSLQVPGRHNVSNALQAIALAGHAGVAPRKSADVLRTFRGAHRRFEVLGEPGGITVIDDYAHHPTEVRTVLQAARDRYPDRRIVAVFQPHTYSRVKTLLPEFRNAFVNADVVLLTDIYAARERDTLGVHSRDLAATVLHADLRYVGGLDEAEREARRTLLPGDVLITLGAGDVNRVAMALAAG